MNVGILNVEGFRGPDDATRTASHVMRLHQLDALVCTETWLTPDKKVHVPGASCFLSDAPHVQRTNRHQGGVMVCVRTPLIVHTAAGVCTPFYQAMTVNFYNPTLKEDLTLSGVYVSPRCPVEELSRLLRHLAGAGGPAAILAGDFNARHTDWDRAQNTRGGALRQFVLRRHYHTAIPTSPTYSSRQGSSTVDFSICRGLDAISCIVRHGSWNNTSRHRLVVTKFTPCPPGSTRVPSTVLSNPNVRKKVQECYTKSLPILTSEAAGVSTEKELNLLMNRIQDHTLQPWLPHVRRKPRRFRPGWTFRLERKSKRRRSLLQAAQLRHDPTLRKEAMTLDREIKREFRRNKRRALRQALRTACEDENSSLTQVSQVLHRFGVHAGSPHTLDIDPAEYTAHLRSLQREDEQVELTPFYPLQELEKEIRTAITRGRKGKAPGCDGIVYDMMQLDPEGYAKLLLEVWAAVGRTEHMPTALREGVVYPLYKKGDTGLPESYRPIVLLSHMRKAISSAVNSIITHQYCFHPNQWGFQKRMGTEQAIIHTQHMISQGQHTVAVLDLKKAYDTVPRTKLIDICENRLGSSITDMIRPLLAPMPVRTKGQSWAAAPASLRCGVPQGDCISPTLYNMFMDPLLEKISDKYANGLSCYCDDTTAVAKSNQDLQDILNEAQDWAAANGMEWNVAKCSAICDEPGVTLNGAPINRATEVPYLGVSLTQQGVSDTRLQERIRNAGYLLHKLTGLTRGLHLSHLQRYHLFRSQIVSRVDYALHCTPLSPEVATQGNRLEQRGLAWCLSRKPVGIKDLERAAALVGFLPLHHRRKRLAWRMISRLLHTMQLGNQGNRVARDRASKAERVLRLYQHMQQSPLAGLGHLGKPSLERKCESVLESIWPQMLQHVNRHKTRPLPNSKRRGPAPVLRARVAPEVKRLSILWYMYKLPSPTIPVPKHQHEAIRLALEASTLTKRHATALTAALAGVGGKHRGKRGTQKWRREDERAWLEEHGRNEVQRSAEPQHTR